MPSETRYRRTARTGMCPAITGLIMFLHGASNSKHTWQQLLCHLTYEPHCPKNPGIFRDSIWKKQLHQQELPPHWLLLRSSTTTKNPLSGMHWSTFANYTIPALSTHSSTHSFTHSSGHPDYSPLQDLEKTGQNGNPGNADMNGQDRDGHPYHHQTAAEAAASTAGFNLWWSSANAEAGRNASWSRIHRPPWHLEHPSRHTDQRRLFRSMYLSNGVVLHSGGLVQC